ncbi:hypothetical protein [Paraburkholderia caballeronis]|uniref:hypothetical protein n=1 Tax=Paraburkholderia caballeronis TaxID=416943 RepID=UPI00115FD9F8|nr:hypothetical protein [Paraburkholderia caballeronis]
MTGAARSRGARRRAGRATTLVRAGKRGKKQIAWKKAMQFAVPRGAARRGEIRWRAAAVAAKIAIEAA